MNNKEYIYGVLNGDIMRDNFNSLMSDNGVIYSYGYHYPLATIIDNIGYVNNRGYSNTTSKHIGLAQGALFKIVGYNNTHCVELLGNNFNLENILNSYNFKLDNLRAIMASKSRHDTQVFRQLERQFAMSVNSRNVTIDLIDAKRTGLSDLINRINERV